MTIFMKSTKSQKQLTKELTRRNLLSQSIIGSMTKKQGKHFCKCGQTFLSIMFAHFHKHYFENVQVEDWNLILWVKSAWPGDNSAQFLLELNWHWLRLRQSVGLNNIKEGLCYSNHKLFHLFSWVNLSHSWATLMG